MQVAIAAAQKCSIASDSGAALNLIVCLIRPHGFSGSCIEAVELSVLARDQHVIFVERCATVDFTLSFLFPNLFSVSDVDSIQVAFDVTNDKQFALDRWC